MTEPVSPPSPATDRWKAWDDFLEATPNTGFMQSSWWADFRATAGFEHFGAVLKDRNGVVGGAMVQKFSSAADSGFYYIQDGHVLPGMRWLRKRFLRPYSKASSPIARPNPDN